MNVGAARVGRAPSHPRRALIRGSLAVTPSKAGLLPIAAVPVFRHRRDPVDGERQFAESDSDKLP